MDDGIQNGSDKELAIFLYEIGQLKRVPRSGWLLHGIPNPESVADHCHRTSVIAMILALMEGADMAKVLGMSVLHDSGETRVSDSHRIAGWYLNPKEPERAAVADQMERLPPEIRRMLAPVFHELEAGGTLEADIVHDADKLDCLLQAMEYHEQGYPLALDWATTSEKRLRTKSGVRLASACVVVEPSIWWRRSRHDFGIDT